MKRQVIQNFLNLPGLSGVALIDGRNRPFFFGPDIRLNTPQQDALAQGIQQVVETTPAGFDTFSFRFTNQLVYIYKLEEGLILLVLMADQTSFKDYRPAIRQLKATLMEEPHNVVPTFRLLAGCVTLSNSPATPDLPAWPDAGIPIPVAAEHPVASAAPATPVAAEHPITADNSDSVSFPEILAALNHLSEGAAQYLGKIIVANTWKQARPAQPWLAQFEIQKDGQFTLASPPAEPLTAEQHQWLQDWVRAFMGKGGRTIRNFQDLVSDGILTPSEKDLLLGPIDLSNGSGGTS
jgi:hypothetical protein